MSKLMNALLTPRAKATRLGKTNPAKADYLKNEKAKGKLSHHKTKDFEEVKKEASPPVLLYNLL